MKSAVCIQTNPGEPSYWTVPCQQNRFSLKIKKIIIFNKYKNFTLRISAWLLIKLDFKKSINFAIFFVFLIVLFLIPPGNKLPGGTCQVHKLPGGTCQVIKLPGGTYQVRKLPGGICQVYKLPGGTCQVHKLPGGTCQVHKLLGGTCQVHKLPGGICQVHKLPWGTCQVHKIPGGACQVYKLPGGTCQVHKNHKNGKFIVKNYDKEFMIYNL